MAGNTVKLEFAGDASKLARAAERAEQATDGVGKSATSAGDDFKRAAGSSGDLTTRMGHLGSSVSGASDAIDTASGTMQALVDIQQAGKEKASRLARATQDVAEAAQDMRQAVRDAARASLDGRQAAIDEESARIGQREAMQDYTEAVKKHGVHSVEAARAQNDLKQAGFDVKSAQEDAKQAIEDGREATNDLKSAQLDLNDAQRESHPPEMQGWADQMALIGPLVSGLVGIIGLVTGAQWLWNAAQLASPTTWIVLAIVALIAVIVLIATKTTWFQDLWKAAWGGIKAAASAVGSWFKDTLWGKWIKGAWEAIKNAGIGVWNWMKDLPGKLKSVFSKVAGFITAPFRAAFNFVADAWNNTVGRLSWTVPGWVPHFGGNTVSAPQLPHFHSGGVVPGTPGSETLAVLQAGERVQTRGGGDRTVIELRSDGGAAADFLIEMLSKAVRQRGGNAQLVLGGRNA